MNPSARMLRLLSLLQTHRYWPGEELSERLAVSPRTLRRDIDRLRELGYAVDASRGVAGGYQLRAGGSLPPLLLEDEEAVAIAVGLRTAAAGAVSGMEETSVQALTKVIGLMPPRLRRRMDAVRSQTDNLVWARRARSSTPTYSPRWPRPVATTSWCGSATPPGAPNGPNAGWSRCDWSPSAAAGTSWPTTATARTGARSGSTGSPMS